MVGFFCIFKTKFCKLFQMYHSSPFPPMCIHGNIRFGKNQKKNYLLNLINKCINFINNSILFRKKNIDNAFLFSYLVSYFLMPFSCPTCPIPYRFYFSVIFYWVIQTIELTRYVSKNYWYLV